MLDFEIGECVFVMTNWEYSGWFTITDKSGIGEGAEYLGRNEDYPEFLFSAQDIVSGE